MKRSSIIVSKQDMKNQKNKISANQQVNRVGKYLYKNLDGAYKIEYGVNTCDVFVILLYQIPYLHQIPGKGKEYNDVKEMNLDLNITTYQNKLRVNIIEMDENERTLGHNVYDLEKLVNLNEAKELIFNNVVKKVSKAYEEYDFLF